MKLPVSWLKEYIEVNLSPEKLEEVLTMSGSKVEAIQKKGADTVIEIEVTTNRPDTLSILGLAREVSALTSKKVQFPAVYSKTKKISKTTSSKEIEILVEEKKGCPKYTARILKNVSIKDAPAKTRSFLSAVDVRAVNNAVDATNFVLFECGQPLHAFDYDKISGKKIIVRFSRKGEKFTGIDGMEHELDDKTLVIADAKSPIAIAGVMGGKSTEVTSSTKNILLESAYFDPALVRQAARKYKISTESSYRFERGVDPGNIEQASERASGLILEWAGGEEVPGLLSKDFSKKPAVSSISLRLARVEALLGMKVAQPKILSIFKALGLEAKASGSGKVTVKVPTFRRDLIQETDLIEEVLRIQGFEKIPTIIPATSHGKQRAESPKAAGISEAKKFMAALGFQEIITYSLLSLKALKDAGFSPEKSHKIVNAVSAEQEYFRPSLLPGMLGALLFNVHRKAASARFFEVGNRCVGGKEETVLGILFYGSLENHWLRKTDASFYDLKGAVQNFFDFLKVKDPVWSGQEAPAGLGQSLSVALEGKPLAYLGTVLPLVQKKFDLPKEAFYAEIVLEDIWAEKKRSFKVKPVAKFPLVRRDIAFVIDEKVAVADLEGTMRRAASGYLQEVQLFDQYIGKNISSGKRSLAFSLAYQKETGTFTEDEILSLQKKVGEALKQEYQVEFRS